jgi:pyruvate dehydrogenase E2 component (dihydrolipoamide acetyltransferase)
MPALGAGMDVGRVLEWYVQPGDEIRRGGIIALVETDKANIEVEVFEAGVVEELLVATGTKVPVGTPLARIGTAVPAAVTPTAAPAEPVPAEPVAAEPVAAEPVAAEPVPAEAARTEEKEEPPQTGAQEAVVEAAETVTAAAAAAAGGPVGGVVDEHPVTSSPLVRRQAKEAGVDLTRVRGTGPEGVITRHDVAAAALARTVARAAVPVAGPGAVPAGGARSSPYARRLAAERGLELGALAGSGPGGALLASDVLAAPRPAVEEAASEPGPATGPPASAPAPAPAPPAPEAAAPTAAPSKEDRTLAMRRAIARAMERSNREIPHYHLGETVDVDATLDWLAARNAELPPASRVLPAALVLKATALALREYPDLNGYWVDDAFRPGDGIHLGVAINLRRGGLLAPAIRDADERSLAELMEALKDLVQRTRSGGLRGSELTDPTITVSNLGDTGVERIHGVITPPQVALVGVGRITERPWAVDGLLAVRRTIALSLAGDHRASDGHRGGRFLAAIATNLTRPELL